MLPASIFLDSSQCSDVYKRQPEILRALYSLISDDGQLNEEKYDRYVNDKVRLSLYGDFLYPLAEDSSLSDFYKEKPEGVYSEELEPARTSCLLYTSTSERSSPR